MEKINIAELLKDCPKGMELDCTTYNDVTFLRVDETQNRCYFKTGPADTFWTTCDGCLNYSHFAKCVIFPKGKTTWEGFVPPSKFKDGDVVTYKYENGLVSMILNKFVNFVEVHYHCALYDNAKGFITNNYIVGEPKYTRLATEEEKQKLFNAIKENGYRWNAEKKELEKLVVPNFKVGDRVLWNYDTNKIPRTISKVQLTSKRGYVYWIECKGCSSGWWNENELTPIPNKFDINTLKAFESRVLVRDKNTDEWRGQFFSHYYESKRSDKPYICIGVEGLCEYKQCIPFENNEYLLGTTNDCDDFYKTWE